MKVLDCQQYDPAWWEARRGVPTASQFSRFFTPKTEKLGTGAITYAHELIAQKYDLDYGLENEPKSAAMRHGTDMEPETRRWYEFVRDKKVMEVGFCLTDDGRFGASPDGVMPDENRGFECKRPLAHTQVKYLLDGGLPVEYKAQVHGGLIVTGYERWDFLSYYPGLPPLLVTVEPDAFTERLRKGMDDFWEIYQELLGKMQDKPDPVRDMQREPVASYF